MKIRYFNAKEDYEFLKQWWLRHGKVAPDLEFLSDIGIVYIDDDERPVAAGFIYTTNSKMALLEYLVTDPLAPIFKRGIAVKQLIKFGIEESKRNGAKVIITSVKNKKLINFYKKIGFIEDSGESKNMIKII